ncbi:uncharacterized protein LTR77_001749 [Saxophila tyrrhenica]|uniref:Ankyrin n=1 Tax=Saxophila tyrrhenica TaxID=1690608 RepID=A0AAV9PQS0_9PEZI|nr:hypothetical protein LTR77_001749 [Saxophila tyrrhenica]
MTENSTVRCGYCRAVTSRVIQISTPGDAPHQPKRTTTLTAEYRASATFSSDAIENSSETSLAYRALDDTITTKTIDKAITHQPEINNRASKSALLQLLLGQALPDPGLLQSLAIGRLIQVALQARNRDAWRLLAPLFQVVNHPALAQAIDVQLDVPSAVEDLGSLAIATPNNAVVLFGLEKTKVLASLGIISIDKGAAGVCEAAKSSSVGELQLLLSLGVDTTVLGLALYRAKTAEVAETLCQAGAPVAARGVDGNTTIIEACLCERKEVLEVLLRQPGVREILDVRNAFGKAAVHYAGEREDMLEMLRQAGANMKLAVGPRERVAWNYMLAGLLYGAKASTSLHRPKRPKLAPVNSHALQHNFRIAQAKHISSSQPLLPPLRNIIRNVLCYSVQIRPRSRPTIARIRLHNWRDDRSKSRQRALHLCAELDSVDSGVVQIAHILLRDTHIVASADTVEVASDVSREVVCENLFVGKDMAGYILDFSKAVEGQPAWVNDVDEHEDAVVRGVDVWFRGGGYKPYA